MPREIDWGIVRAVGVLSAANKVLPGAWVVTFPPEQLPREDSECYHGAVLGPGGYFVVYLDTSLHSNGANGLINTYEPTIPMFVRRGRTITFHWSTTSTPAPQVWLYFRAPEVGRL
jgi:hypothetical protein